ncbi:MAG: C39 family peptidase [Patescibacteria group bacterium]|nr:C39 family peptidase [Patescibacteria group bacterium]
MKRKIIIILGILLLMAVGLYFGRHWLRDQWTLMNRPNLPAATGYQDKNTENPDDSINADLPAGPPSHIEGGIAKSESFILESSPQTKDPVKEPEAQDPLAGDIEIPSELNLDVPWMSQAPKSNWDFPYQEACEEASMIMVDAFYSKRTGKIAVAEADAEILKLVDYQNKTLGDYKDTTAEETAQIIRDYYGYTDVRVFPISDPKDIQSVLARGYPVIMPFSGKELENPNFRNGGPLYHMLVVKGYTDDGHFITGDPGTRLGQDFIYTFENLMESAHDWNGGNVTEGKKVMIVILPNKSTD